MSTVAAAPEKLDEGQVRLIRQILDELARVYGWTKSETVKPERYAEMLKQRADMLKKYIHDADGLTKTVPNLADALHALQKKEAVL